MLDRSWIVLVGSLVALQLVAPSRADACGGTFCDGGGANPMPMSMPVEQTGENIFFVVDEGFVEAHIQIQYDPETDAANFAWLVPVMATPEFSVGSQQLFTSLGNATVPSYGYVQQFDSCGGGGGFGDDGDFCEGSGDDGAGFTTALDESGGDDGATTGGGTEVVLQQTVGSFEAVVLQSTGAGELMQWLGDNGYYQDPNAEPILQQYIDDGFQFAAFRLAQSEGAAEIHPIVMRYAGDEPCIPIELTRIAAQEDMDIRAFFLGEARVVPTNYRHVVWNPAKLDWIGLGANYEAVVTMAVDEPTADGHAFVTEYAGSSGIVDPLPLFPDAWQPEAFTGATPSEALEAATAQTLLACTPVGCEFAHPLIHGVFSTYLPAPEGSTEPEFWSQVLAGTADEADLEAWDTAAFEAAINDRVFAPARHGRDLLEQHGYLTRLYTTISPAEMTEDPTFHTTTTLGDVDDTARINTLHTDCSSRSEMQGVGDFAAIRVPSPSMWPDIMPEQMPWALRIESIPVEGAPIDVVDNTALVDGLIAEWNVATSMIQVSPRACDDDGGFESGDQTPDGDGKGCGCSAREPGFGGLAVATLALLGLRRRRRT